MKILVFILPHFASIFSGGDHIETKAVRSYLNNLEASLKAAKNDARSYERPYSSLTWRSQDLANIEKKSRIQSGKSSSYGQISRPASQISKTGSHISRPISHTVSRPVSQIDLTCATPSQKSSMVAYLPASERIMLESNKPRLLHRESMNRKLKNKQEMMSSSFTSQYSPEMQSSEHLLEEPRRQINVEVDTGNMLDTADSGVLLDSYGNEIDKTAVKFQSQNHMDEPAGRDSPPQRLFKRFGSPQNAMNGELGLRSGEVTLRTSESNLIVKRDSSFKHKRPAGSARSIGSSLHTSASGISLASHRSNCDIPRGPHSLHVSNSRTTTVGPYSSVKSLLMSSGPKDISKGVHHKSAWYHVPGRYTTSDKRYPPKRSQQRFEAKQLSKTIAPLAPNPHKSFMNSEYRKNNPRMLYKGYPGKDGHTCSKGQTYTPYPRDKKQYIICDTCQQEAVEIMAAREQEMMGMVEGELMPKVSGLTNPDRPKQVGYVLEDPVVPDDYETFHPTTVTFKEAVVIN